jgi:excisionase family DNA binding protein
MADQPTRHGAEPETRWVSLGRACTILGVNESTVRRWADAGKIRVFRTPGGHRRFAEADLIAMTTGRLGQNELGSAAVNRIRRQLNASSAEVPWYHDLGTDEREALRPLGRRLVEIVDNYLSGRGDRAELDLEVDGIGASYGHELRGRGVPLGQAIQAVVFFRRSLDETAKQLSARDRLPDEDAARAREEIAGLADRVLVGVAAAYESN